MTKSSLTPAHLLTLLFALAALGPASAFAQGKLQIHHMNVGQGDGAVMITPSGKTVLFDAGKDLNKKSCTRPLAYLDQLGVKRIDAIFVSHYHYDHIGCIPEILKQFPLNGPAYDRGDSYDNVTYGAYVTAVKSRRKTAKVGQEIVFDQNTANPVKVTVVAINGKSQSSDVDTDNENDLSLAAVVSFGRFREELGGDLSGDNTDNYKDIEDRRGPRSRAP